MRRPPAATAESNEITLMPRCMAFLQTGTSALASSAAMMSPSTFWAISESRTAIWSSAVGLVGAV